MIASLARQLTCIDCGTKFALGYRLECDTCHGLLELGYDWDRIIELKELGATY